MIYKLKLAVKFLPLICVIFGIDLLSFTDVNCNAIEPKSETYFPEVSASHPQSVSETNFDSDSYYYVWEYYYDYGSCAKY